MIYVVWNRAKLTSAVSRAILKPAYRFGIPNSTPQTLKSVDFWCKLSSTFFLAEPRERCFELFRTQNSQKFPGFRPWTPLGRAYSAAPDSPAAQRFFSSLRSSKNRHPQKNCWIRHCLREVGNFLEKPMQLLATFNPANILQKFTGDFQASREKMLITKVYQYYSSTNFRDMLW